ncbi:MAG: STAS domain-containing protein [Bacillus sp. (in: firmicutes)]
MDNHFFETEESIDLLDSIGENIFIADENLHIVWINKYADQLINKIGKHIGISKKEELIGRHINEFHKNPAKQREILLNGPFPYETTINLFNSYTANIVVNPFYTKGQKRGFILTWKDITEFSERENYNKKLLEELYTPIISTVIDNVCLIPINGSLTVERLQKMSERILKESAKLHSEVIIVDFTGVTGLMGESSLHELENLTKSLKLLGATVIYSGFSVEMAQHLINNNISITAPTFKSFKQAMKYLLTVEKFTIDFI